MARGARLAALLLLVICAAAEAASAIQDGLLPNGNFEEAPNKSQLNGTRVTGCYAIPRWETSGFVEYIESGHKQGDMLLPVPEGKHAVRLGNEASVRQKLTVAPGGRYSITFSAARTCAQTEKLNVTVTPDSGDLPIQTVYTSSGWDSYSWAFIAKRSDVWLIIHNPGVTEDAACGPLIDSFAIKTIQPPQPAAKGNLLKNGDFEEGPYISPNSPWGVLVPPVDEDDYSPISPWTILSWTKSVKYLDAEHFAVPHGARAVELLSGRETALVQNASTAPGQAYRLRFSVGDARNGCQGPMVVQAYAGGGSVTVQYKSEGKGGHTRGELNFTAAEPQTPVAFVSMSYNTKNDGTLCGPVVDDVSLVCTGKRPARRLLL